MKVLINILMVILALFIAQVAWPVQADYPNAAEQKACDKENAKQVNAKKAASKPIKKPKVEQSKKAIKPKTEDKVNGVCLPPDCG